MNDVEYHMSLDALINIYLFTVLKHSTIFLHFLISIFTSSFKKIASCIVYSSQLKIAIHPNTENSAKRVV